MSLRFDSFMLLFLYLDFLFLFKVQQKSCRTNGEWQRTRHKHQTCLKKWMIFPSDFPDSRPADEREMSPRHRVQAKAEKEEVTWLLYHSLGNLTSFILNNRIRGLLMDYWLVLAWSGLSHAECTLGFCCFALGIF